MSTKLNEVVHFGFFHKIGKWLFSHYSYLVFRTYLHLKIEGKEHLPDVPFIICSNHQSHLDAIILGHVGVYYFSRSALIAAKDYWYDQKKRFRLSQYFFNIIPISRNESGKAFHMLDVKNLINQFLHSGGKCVVILPEGTRSGNGRIRSFKPGIITLSISCDLPIVPVYIENSGHFWPRGSFFVRPGSMRIKIGKPIFPKELEQTRDPEQIRNQILALSQNE